MIQKTLKMIQKRKLIIDDSFVAFVEQKRRIFYEGGALKLREKNIENVLSALINMKIGLYLE